MSTETKKTIAGLKALCLYAVETGDKAEIADAVNELISLVDTADDYIAKYKAQARTLDLEVEYQTAKANAFGKYVFEKHGPEILDAFMDSNIPSKVDAEFAARFKAIDPAVGAELEKFLAVLKEMKTETNKQINTEAQ